MLDAIPTPCDRTVTVDQRGVSRPQGPRCDIGAVEVADGDLAEPPPPDPPGDDDAVPPTATTPLAVAPRFTG